MRLDEINIPQLNELKTARSAPEVRKFIDFMDVDPTEYEDRVIVFLKYLEGRGYRPMGSGAFAAVFTHPSIDYVIKVFKGDTGYLNFLEYCDKHKGNPSLPRFRGKPMTIDQSHFAVRLEKLLPIRDVNDRTLIKLALSTISGSASLDDFKKRAHHILRDGIDERWNFDSFVETVFDLYQYCGNGGHWDLHTGNIMRRRRGELVITDPFAS